MGFKKPDMQLNLKNPIVFFDLETTGINIASDRIVELSVLKVNVNGSEEVYTKRINPEMPIPNLISMVFMMQMSRTLQPLKALPVSLLSLWKVAILAVLIQTSLTYRCWLRSL